MDGPLVTVCVSNFNYARYLPASLEALLDQTYDRVEVIVVDDGSTDDSREVLRRYADRVTVVCTDNQGHGPACNEGWRRANGEIVMFHDPDDLLLHDAVERIVGAFADDEVVMTFGALAETDEAGRRTGAVHPPAGSRWDGGDLSSMVLERAAFFWPPTCGQAYRKTVLDRVMPIPPTLNPDLWLGYLVALLGRVEVLREPVGLYRMHANSMSHAPRRLGVDWLDLKIAERQRVHEAIEQVAREAHLLHGPWTPNDFIEAELQLARGALTGAPSRRTWLPRAVRAVAGHPQLPRRTQAKKTAWLLATAATPRRFAARVVGPHFPFAVTAARP